MGVARALLALVATLGTVPFSIGLTCLEPPQNVTVHIVNTNITLKWDWDNPCDLNVTFSAQYYEMLDYETNLENWIMIPECQNVISTECDLSLLKLDYLYYCNVNVRVEADKETSPWASLKFSPYLTAQIGPPGVLLESVDGNVKIKIIPPEAHQSKQMWNLDTFTYKLAIWKNSSKSEKKIRDVFSGQNLPDLQPDTTYCLEVKACLEDHKALWSPVYCMKTPKALDALAPPTNLRVHALNMKCILYWDNSYNGSVSFMVQWLYAFKRLHSRDYSKEWITVPGCENITTTYCDFSSSVSFNGIFYLHVRTMNRHSKSPWSEELHFEPLSENEIGPPSIKVNASEDSLHVLIVPPGESENTSISKHYIFTYHIRYWNNSSYVKDKIEEKSTSFIIPNLTFSTVYCLEVQASSYVKSSKFSNVTCVTTSSGKSYQASLVIFIISIVGGIIGIGVIYAVWYIWKRIQYAFFPSCNLPSFIEKTGGKDLSSSYLISSEESTEKCVLVIENSIPAEINQMNSKEHRQSEQSCRDSGNYSNDDDISGSKESHEIKEEGAL
ncbi:interferon alpha/beta receptor 1 [Eublepharis macularius]|uniref:Interferon alpha/beta receptor 1 n=1 Tax=Eublepharis macularius TaxID=481883 RepID=A0AA97J1F5_EUBMA|nr:interferon alpha/beta receptor 1 [Eublepharis macularius]